MTPSELCFDIEANGLKPTKVHMVNCDLDGQKIAFVSDETAAVIGDQSGYGEVRSLSNLPEFWAQHIDAGTLFVGHYILGYDIPVLQKLHGVALPPLTQIRDTSLLGRLWKPDGKNDTFALLRSGVWKKTDINGFNGSYSLKCWGLRIGTHKGEYTGGWDLPNLDMFKYCVQDVVTTKALWERLKLAKLSWRAVENETEFMFWMLKQEQNGFQFNTRAAQELEAKIRTELATITAELREEVPPTIERWTVRRKGRWNRLNFEMALGLPTKEAVIAKYGEGPLTWPDELRPEFWEDREHSEPFNPGSRDQCARFLQSLGWVPVLLTETGKAQIDDEVLEEAAHRFPQATKLSRYFMLNKRLGQLADGDFAWLKLVQDDGKMHGGVITIGTVTGRCAHMKPNMGQVPAARNPYGPEFRGLFSARDGFKLVGADASGLQLRCLAHYLHAFDGGEYVKIVTTGDVHSANQKAAGLLTRDQAKTFIYAWLFGAGPEKIGAIVGGSAKEGKALIDAFLAGLPALGALKKAIGARLRWAKEFDNSQLYGLDGRPLPIRSDHAALNTLLMSAEAVLVKTATCLFAREMTARFGEHGLNWAFCAHVHDEFQVEVRDEFAEEAAKIAAESVTKAGEFWGFLCPLKGDAKIGKTWYDTH